MYYSIHPYRTNLMPSAAFLSQRVYYIKENFMKKYETIESQLDCRATAQLRSTIAEDLSKPDKPITDILSTKDEDKDESENNQPTSD